MAFIAPGRSILSCCSTRARYGSSPETWSSSVTEITPGARASWFQMRQALKRAFARASKFIA